ncbi:AAA family ATPase [Planctomycetes bacterium K23_9]|uniref:Chromosome partition protein Smc n=1 Tax=Stieleria marina TaxID=1930275 RepID=A0A517P1T0_9BACT|nr:Chromosome partition protein Smc [Planctomycetes bacterium K23_9]
MKVKDIHIDGFGVWTGLSVDSLPEGMTLFYGPNEAGKTTLMQFMRAMLYGFTDERREKYLPPIYGGTPGGAVRVTGPGGGYEIRRRHQLTDKSAVGQLSVTGPDGLSQGQHRLSMLLGQIDEPIFTNVFAIGMRELQELSTLDDTKAADELYKLSSGLDRVSLVDVLRNLRGGRQELIGNTRYEDDPDAKKLASLIKRREKLRDEVQSLTSQGRRWSELASQRRTQQQEIAQLTDRMGVWEREARGVEVATNVYDSWQERLKLQTTIEENEREAQPPDEAPGQLVQIEAMMQERREKLEEVKSKRRAIRDKAEQLPVSRRMLDLQGRIEAATEQVTWVEALEEQIERLDQQIEKARTQLGADADRLELDAEDREALVEGESMEMPDLSRQTLAALSGPAKRVKEQAFLLKQSRNEGMEHKQRSEKLGDQLKEVLDRAHASNLQQAIRRENEMINTLRHRAQLGEHLDKLKKHYRGLEEESVNLTTSEALPLDRLFLLSVPFIFGGLALTYGFSHIFGIELFLDREPDASRGLIWFVFGLMSMMLYYFGRQYGQRSSLLDLEDCDRQIDTIRRQIRDAEAEREEVDSGLPNSTQSIEMRLREAEQLLVELESSLPTYHAHEASLQAYKSARSRASTAADRLKEARSGWASTLNRLGLSESMSPTSIRKLGDNYETLQNSRRRLVELQAEREQRQRERQTIAKRIEMLYLEALELNDEAAQQSDEDSEIEVSESPVPRRSHKGPLEQLNHLHEELARAQHWIKRRRDLKEQDSQLKRQQAGHHRALERGEQQRRALWAKCGVATADQFYQMVDTKARLVETRKQRDDLDQQIRSIIGTHIDYDDVAREIDGAKSSDLEKRWESLTTRMTETEARIAHLRTQQGELAAEMKHLGEDGRLSAAQLELGCVQRKIDSVAQRWQMLAMASYLMEDVCGTFERERQPETLREASSFLSQLTDGKYTRIWTPLGTNALKIDSHEGNALPLEVLSRGTREAVFIALRLSLAAAYARRGVMLPLILDDVLVNFDGDRAIHAAQTLKTFAELGHQVMMFTCHEHIVRIFQDIDVQVRLMPPQGEPGRAEILEPEYELEEEQEYEEEEPEEEYVEEVAEVVEEIEVAPEPEPDPEPEPIVVVQKAPEPKIIYVEKPRPEPKRKRKPKPKPQPVYIEREPEPEPEPQYVEPVYLAPARVEPEPEPQIGWAWFEREPLTSEIPTEQRAAETLSAAQRALDSEWLGDQNASEDMPEDVWNRNDSWWDGSQITVK